MFSQACVILFTGGVSASVHAGILHPRPRADTPPADTPWNRHPLHPRNRHQTPHPPSPQSMLRDMVNARAVRILLECNLVERYVITLKRFYIELWSAQFYMLLLLHRNQLNEIKYLQTLFIPSHT